MTGLALTNLVVGYFAKFSMGIISVYPAIIYFHFGFACPQVGWYWGPLSMDKAESKLANKRDGSFLVRDSSHDSYILSLSFRSQSRTHHTRIEFFHGE